ncbi:MAG: SAM-dependent methyltransferase [Ilumatobacteraceae bacterium]|nr:SAM-dependent methyltransferase [Ilumatobacteraceae bacterium]
MTEPIPFDRFMADALYGPDGFYSTGGRAGRRGDFITSPEVGPLFGAVVARFLDAEWRRIGEPDPFLVVDAGAGPGTLARAILGASPACASALRYVTVDVSGPQREQHPSGVESLAELPAGPFDGVIIANELLDNLPFRLAVFDDGWREAYVIAGPDGQWAEHLSDRFDPLPPVLPSAAPLGARAPLQDAAADWVVAARARLRSGTVVVIDYATPTTAGLAVRPWREWLRTYRGHQRGDHYLREPGSQDITTEVALDQLPEPDAVRSQAHWLQLHGIDQLVDEGKRHWAEHASRPDLTALRMRSRVAESEALLDLGGLGGFTVCEWRARSAP